MDWALPAVMLPEPRPEAEGGTPPGLSDLAAGKQTGRAHSRISCMFHKICSGSPASCS